MEVKGCWSGFKETGEEFPRLTFFDGLLCRVVWLSDEGRTTQVVVPAISVPEVLGHLHCTPLTAHLATNMSWLVPEVYVIGPQCTMMLNLGVISVMPVRGESPQSPDFPVAGCVCI